MATGLGEGKPVKLLLKIDLVSHSVRSERLVKYIHNSKTAIATIFFFKNIIYILVLFYEGFNLQHKYIAKLNPYLVFIRLTDSNLYLFLHPIDGK